MEDAEPQITPPKPTFDWQTGPIDGCQLETLDPYRDERGWLMEFFRSDDLPSDLRPTMGYISGTEPGTARGPHAHYAQTDLFVFVSGALRLYLWDAREGCATYGHRQTHDVGVDAPTRAIVPPGVVHGYRNIGDVPGLIVNCPNRLFAGEGRSEPIDEIRYEERDEHPFTMD